VFWHSLATRFKGGFVSLPDISAATAPSAVIADAMSQMGRCRFVGNEYQCNVGKAHFCYYNDMFHSTNATQPITYVKYYAKDVNTIMQFPRLDQGVGNCPLVDYDSTVIGSQQ
jgi:hypothetical protein